LLRNRRASLSPPWLLSTGDQLCCRKSTPGIISRGGVLHNLFLAKVICQQVNSEYIATLARLPAKRLRKERTAALLQKHSGISIRRARQENCFELQLNFTCRVCKTYLVHRRSPVFFQVPAHWQMRCRQCGHLQVTSSKAHISVKRLP